MGGPAILPLSLAKMAQLTQAFPDKSFSGIGGVAEFAHALNYFLLGCGTVQVCTAAMLDHAIGPTVIKTLLAGMADDDGAARLDVARGFPRRHARSRRRAFEDPAPGRRRVSRRLRQRGYAASDVPAARRRPWSMTAGTVRTDVVELTADLSASPLWNPDLAPTPAASRTWSTYHIAALWIGMSVVITTYTLASGLMQQGMTWAQAMLTILLGNSIVLIPMMLNAHAGTKYGVSFPVLCRAAFGVKGANVPALLRAFVACGWFGIQTWIGGLALHALLGAAFPGWLALPGNVWIAFAAFWAVQVAIIVRGLEGIKALESWSAPLLLGGGALLLGWAISRGGGLGHILTESARLQKAHMPFWQLFPAGLTANVGYWATLSLNIPDFTRYARSQRSQVLGQALGLPGDHDRVRVHRRRGDERDDRDLRRGDLGSGAAHRAHRQPAGDRARRAGGARRPAHDQHGGQRRVAGQRLLESRPEAHQLRRPAA